MFELWYTERESWWQQNNLACSRTGENQRCLGPIQQFLDRDTRYNSLFVSIFATAWTASSITNILVLTRNRVGNVTSPRNDFNTHFGEFLSFFVYFSVREVVRRKLTFLWPFSPGCFPVWWRLGKQSTKEPRQEELFRPDNTDTQAGIRFVAPKIGIQVHWGIGLCK